MRAPPLPTTYDGSSYPSYNSANSSALEATTVWGTHGRVIVNDVRPVLDDTSIMSEEVPVINNTSAKLIGVVVDLCSQ